MAGLTMLKYSTNSCPLDIKMIKKKCPSLLFSWRSAYYSRPTGQAIMFYSCDSFIYT